MCRVRLASLFPGGRWESFTSWLRVLIALVVAARCAAICAGAFRRPAAARTRSQLVA
jgi:hypothetical protein